MLSRIQYNILMDDHDGTSYTPYAIYKGLQPYSVRVKHIATIILMVVLYTSSVIAGDIDSLIPHLIQVESRGNQYALGDNGKAYGCLQIWAVCVLDVNRIYKSTYVHDDAWDIELSKEICHMYLTYWGKRYTLNTSKTPTTEVYARIWNGGPRGYKKEQTLAYWVKVKQSINSEGGK